MSKRSTLLMRIEKLIIFFLTELRNARLLPLQIPALSSCGDLQEIMETDDNLFSMGEKKIFRYIDSPQSSRIYAQLMAVIALVAELQTCIAPSYTNESYLIFDNSISGKKYFAARCLLFFEITI